MWRKRAGIIILTLAICLLGLELGLRAIGRQPTNMSDGIYEQDGESFRLKKNVTKLIRYPAFSYTIHTNAFGLRDETTGPRDLGGRPFFAFLGASDVFGNGVEYRDSFVGIFSAEARRRGLDALNFATGGHYFLDQERLIERFIEETGIKPATIVFCVNALHIPKFDQRNHQIIVRGGHPIDRDGWRVTYLRLIAGNLSSAFCFFRDAVRRIQEKFLKYGVSAKSPEFLDSYSKANPLRGPERTRSFEQHLTRFEAYCRDRQIELIYVYLPLSDSFRLNDMLIQIGKNPADYDVTFFESLMASHCETAGQRLVNLRPVLQSQYSEGRELRFKLDPHFNVVANLVIGESLITAILGPR